MTSYPELDHLDLDKLGVKVKKGKNDIIKEKYTENYQPANY